MSSKDRSESYENDAITSALQIIGDRWSLLILRGVFRGLHRFGELRDDLGIASNLLTDRLNTLVGEGILTKIPYQQRPVRHEYRLTTAGLELSPVLISIMKWGDTTLVHAACDAPIENITRCTACDETLDAPEIRRSTKQTTS